MKNPVWSAVLMASTLCWFSFGRTPAADSTRLLRQPDVSRDRIVFAHGGDLWTVGRSGGAARRLTSFPGVESEPRFSPDGRRVAFTGRYDGNTDVYVVPVEGGEPRRLTYHPGPDFCRGWTPDGAAVVFASGRTGAPIPYPRFWIIPIGGGFPRPMAMPRAWYGEFSPDGAQFAYQEVQHWETEFRNYRGGQNKPIWILRLSHLSLSKVPWDGANDSQPVWIGDTIYFLSDRDFAVNVWAYDTKNSRVRQLTHFRTYDARDLQAGAGALVFEQAGVLHLLEPATGRQETVPITVRGDFSWARPHWEDVSKLMSHPFLSPTGKRALFEARGDIFTVPAEKGDVRDLTSTSGAAERAPAWSPDGNRISW
ncbi:MAG: protease, partial [Acidobacteriota bacterium]